MMTSKRSLYALLLWLLCLPAWANIPSRVQVAGMQVSLDDYAKKQVQQKVNSLTMSSKHYQEYVRRCELYFPLIEQVLTENGMPADLKYLALMESALVPEAVSSSQAVGFWQFKDFTAREVGLRVDGQVDQRMHLTASTQGAALYLKRNQEKLRNWMYTLLSYNLGLGGASQLVEQKYVGASEMPLNKESNIYLLHFLANKLAFDKVDTKRPSGPIRLLRYTRAKGKRLSEVAQLTGIEQQTLQSFNPWLKGADRVPSDKEYELILPAPSAKADEIARRLQLEQQLPEELPGKQPEDTPAKKEEDLLAGTYPQISGRTARTAGKLTLEFAEVNGIPGFIGGEEKDLRTLAEAFDLNLQKILRYNDMTLFDEVVPGQVYYLKSKHRKPKASFHTADKEQSLWEVSQKFGVRISLLARRNRMNEKEPLQRGRVLWLRKRRPSSTPVKIETLPPLAETPKPEQPVQPVQPEVKPTPDVQPSVDPTATTHKVRQGESLMQIAGYYGSSVSDLQAWNSLGSNLYPSEGTLLRVKPPVRPNKPGFHLVAKGESIYNISKLYDIPVDSLLTWNGLRDGSSLRYEQELRLTPPSQESVSLDPVYYTVGKDDDIYYVCFKHAIARDHFLRWNQLREDAQLKEGQKVVVGMRRKETPEVKPEPKPEVEPEVKPEPKPEPKPEVEPEVKPEPKPEPKPEVKPEVKPEPKPEVKPEVKPKPKPTEVKPKPEPEKPKPATIHVVAKGETLYGIARQYGISPKDLIAWNELSEDGGLREGQELKVKGTKPAEKPAEKPAPRPESKPAATHVVAKGETLYGIAREYGISPKDLIAWNELSEDGGLREGQELKVKGGKPSETAVAKPKPSDSHVVAKGETLSAIARQYGVSLKDLINWNELSENGDIREGQELKVKGSKPTATKPSSKAQYHEVQKGETLSAIARKYGLSISALQQLNDLKDGNIRPGQQLQVK